MFIIIAFVSVGSVITCSSGCISHCPILWDHPVLPVSPSLLFMLIVLTYVSCLCMYGAFLYILPNLLPCHYITHLVFCPSLYRQILAVAYACVPCLSAGFTVAVTCYTPLDLLGGAGAHPVLPSEGLFYAVCISRVDVLNCALIHC